MPEDYQAVNNSENRSGLEIGNFNNAENNSYTTPIKLNNKNGEANSDKKTGFNPYNINFDEFKDDFGKSIDIPRYMNKLFYIKKKKIADEMASHKPHSNYAKSFVQSIIIDKDEGPADLSRIGLMSYIQNKYFESFTKSNSCCFGRAHQQMRIYNLMDNYLTESLEMDNYEKKYFQFEMLKYMVLDPHQIQCFEKIPFLEGWSIMQQIRDQKRTKGVMSVANSLISKPADVEKLGMIDKKLNGLFLS
jgi:hypothetical protein